MDVDLCAGGDSTRRKVDLAGVSDVTMDLVPLEMYDSARAKIAANLRWLFAKAYGIDHIPEDLRDPFYTDQYEQEHIKPPVIHLLLSCELYCRVCALILKTEQAASLQSHLSVIQALSRKGIYVVESDDTPVTDEDLACVPIKMRDQWKRLLLLSSSSINLRYKPFRPWELISTVYFKTLFMDLIYTAYSEFETYFAA